MSTTKIAVAVPIVTCIPSANDPQQPVLAVKDKLAIMTSSLSDTLGYEVVTLTVGSAHTKFIVHKGLLCDKATYFRKMFTGGFAETSTSAADFPEDDPQAFGLLVGWLYSGEIDVVKDLGHTDDVINLFALAEKLMVDNLADDTMNHLITFMKAKDYLATTNQMVRGYTITHCGSRLRLFLARTYVYTTLHFSDKYGIHSPWSNARLQKAVTDNADLLGDVLPMMRLQAGKLLVDPRYEHICEYHQHSKGDYCPYIER